MPVSSNEQKDPANVARGLKSTMHNPRVSDKAKADASARLDEMSGDTDDSVIPQEQDSAYDEEEYEDDDMEEVDNTTSKKASQPLHTGERDLHEVRVLAGYKATLHNPRVSNEAKQHAEEVLAEKDAL
ncbi:Conidiation protein 6-domain-containing protein [Mucidula mucida]|nr:Conidiation protein 6-domain-containing protein [Mucidula mucida]